MADKNMKIEKTRGCGDGGCVFRAPSDRGQHTNAGCRCLPLRMTPAERVILRKQIRAVVKEVDALRSQASLNVEERLDTRDDTNREQEKSSQAKYDLLRRLWRRIDGDQEGDAPNAQAMEDGLVRLFDEMRHDVERCAADENESTQKAEQERERADRAEAERDRLAARVAGLKAARIGYASEFPVATKADPVNGVLPGDPDVGRVQENIRTLKARAEAAEAERDRLALNAKARDGLLTRRTDALRAAERRIVELEAAAAPVEWREGVPSVEDVLKTIAEVSVELNGSLTNTERFTLADRLAQLAAELEAVYDTDDGAASGAEGVADAG